MNPANDNYRMLSVMNPSVDLSKNYSTVIAVDAIYPMLFESHQEFAIFPRWDQC